MRNSLTQNYACLHLSAFVFELFSQDLVLTSFIFNLGFYELDLHFKLLLLYSASTVNIEKGMAFPHIDPRIIICLVATSIDSLLVVLMITCDRSTYLLRLNQSRLNVVTIPSTVE